MMYHTYSYIIAIIPISKSEEKDYAIENIVQGKIIKIKSEGNQSGINIIFNGSKVNSLNIIKSQSLGEIRNILKIHIKEEFIFLEQEEHPVEKDDENGYQLEDILDNNSIILKRTNFPPATIFSQTEDNIQHSYKKNKLKKISYDFSKFEILDHKRKDLITYKYSNVPKESDHDLVYQYFYDVYQSTDYFNAYVILFCGKIGDGKITAINAFFNIVKGVKLENNL